VARSTAIFSVLADSLSVWKIQFGRHLKHATSSGSTVLFALVRGAAPAHPHSVAFERGEYISFFFFCQFPRLGRAGGICERRSWTDLPSVHQKDAPLSTSKGMKLNI